MSSDEYELLIQQRDARYERDMKAMSDMLDEATGLKKGSEQGQHIPVIF